MRHQDLMFPCDSTVPCLLPELLQCSRRWCSAHFVEGYMQLVMAQETAENEVSFILF